MLFLFQIAAMLFLREGFFSVYFVFKSYEAKLLTLSGHFVYKSYEAKLQSLLLEKEKKKCVNRDSNLANLEEDEN